MNDSKNYAIFPADDFIFFHLAEGYDKIKRHTPSDEEAQAAISLLVEYLENNSHKDLFSNHYDKNPNIRLEEYKIQLSGYFNDQDELIIQANCFRGDDDNWQNQLMWFDDGGNAYFEVNFNLSQMKIISIRVNGVS